MLLSQLGSATCGVWTTADAYAAGLTRHQVAARVAAGEWQRLHRGVFTTGGTAPDSVQRAWAAVLAAGPGSIAAGRTAARLYGLPLLDDHGVGDVISRGRSRAELLVHRWPCAAVTRVAGCPVTTVAQTLTDLRRFAPRDAVVCAADAALHRELVSPAELHPAICAVADGRAESPLETLTRLLLLSSVPTLQPQLEVFGADGGLVARLDLGDPALRLGVEADGRSWHSAWDAVARDRAREDRLRRLGWEIVRVTWHDVRYQPERTVQRVLAAAARRSAAA